MPTARYVRREPAPAGSEASSWPVPGSRTVASGRRWRPGAVGYQTAPRPPVVSVTRSGASQSCRASGVPGCCGSGGHHVSCVQHREPGADRNLDPSQALVCPRAWAGCPARAPAGVLVDGAPPPRQAPDGAEFSRGGSSPRGPCGACARFAGPGIPRPGHVAGLSLQGGQSGRCEFDRLAGVRERPARARAAGCTPSPPRHPPAPVVSYSSPGTALCRSSERRGGLSSTDCWSRCVVMPGRRVRRVIDARSRCRPASSAAKNRVDET